MRVHECVQSQGRRGRSWGKVKLQRLREWKHGVINSLGTSSSLGLESMNKGRNTRLSYFQDATWLSCSMWCLATNTDSWAQPLHKWAPGPVVCWNCSLSAWHRQAWHKPESLFSKKCCLLRIFDASGKGGGGDEEGDLVSLPNTTTNSVWEKHLTSLSLCLIVLKRGITGIDCQGSLGYGDKMLPSQFYKHWYMPNASSYGETEFYGVHFLAWQSRLLSLLSTLVFSWSCNPVCLAESLLFLSPSLWWFPLLLIWL